MTAIPFANSGTPDFVPALPCNPVWVFGAGWRLDDGEPCPELDFETEVARAQSGFYDPLAALSLEALAMPGPVGPLGFWKWLFG